MAILSMPSLPQDDGKAKTPGWAGMARRISSACSGAKSTTRSKWKLVATRELWPRSSLCLLCPMVLPGINKRDAGGTEVGNIAGCDGHSVGESGGGNEGVSLRMRIWNVKRGTANSSLCVDWENSV